MDKQTIRDDISSKMLCDSLHSMTTAYLKVSSGSGYYDYCMHDVSDPKPYYNVGKCIKYIIVNPAKLVKQNKWLRDELPKDKKLDYAQIGGRPDKDIWKNRL